MNLILKALMLILTLSLIACKGESLEAPQTPESVAIQFFDAIYVSKDTSLALPLVSPELREVIEHYHIAVSVQRHVLGLVMTDVTLKIEEIDIDFFRKFTDDVNVVVKMEGLKGGRPWVDDRTIRIIKKGKTWQIVEVVPEKGRINRGGN